MELAPGTKLGPYEVLEPLGAGGMGQVWKARDPRLGRDVAIKIIAHEKSADATLQSRFEREARALSALNHPNIVCVYDMGEHDGAQYIVSELVHGESLRQRISRGPLPSDALLSIATQIAGALTTAHAAGIVHRDLKPENIMVTDEGVPKILDFGLARRLASSTTNPDSTVTQTTATQPGTVMGTAGYMSPEQICGEAVDGRSDIFSMGVVLYEMATGARAFHGRSSIEMMSSILKDDPPHLPAKVNEGLDRIIRRCLEKNPAKRFQNAAELNAALSALRQPAGFFSGNRRWIIAAAAVPELILLGWAFLHGGKKAAPVPQQTAAAVESGRPVAAPPAPPATPVTENAAPTKATPPVEPPAPPPKKAEPAPEKKSESAGAAQKNSADEAAYQQAFDQGMLALSQRRMPEAIDRLTEATRLKPNSAASNLGLCHALMQNLDKERALTACTDAVRLNPNSADAYHDRGNANLMLLKYDRAVEDMNAAIRLGDTNLALAHNIRGRAHAGLKEWGDAITDYDEAIRLNPQQPHYYLFRGTAYLSRNQNKKAIEDFDQALKLQPNLPAAYSQRAIAKRRTGDATGAESDREHAKGLRGK